LAAIASVVYYALMLSAFHEEPDVRKPAFEVVDLPGKGKGIVALRDIRQGELLIQEEPLFLVPAQIQGSPTATIHKALSKLNPEQLSNFHNLSYIEPTGGFNLEEERAIQVALAIFQTNAVSAGEAVGLFPRMARLNHGCAGAFTAVYSWREREGVIVVHAIKPIKKGEEILTTYTNTKKPRAERQNFLLQQYGFNCTCAICSLPDARSRASDKRLAHMTELSEKLARWRYANIDGDEAIEVVRKIWDVREREGYWSERGQLAADATWVAAGHSDAVATREWATLAVRWYGYELGVDSTHVQKMQQTRDRPETHPAWGTRDRMLVGGPGDRL